MLKVSILDETGDTEVMCETQIQLDKVITDNKGKWFYIDGNFRDGLSAGEVTIDGIREFTITEPLIGG